MKRLLRFGVSAGLLFWIGTKTDWSQVGEAFANLRLGWWLGAVALLVGAQMLSTIRWQMLAGALRFERSLGSLLKILFVGMFFNLVLPTSIGGDVVRAWYLDGGSGRRLAALASVFLDRLVGLIVLLAMAVAAVLLSPLELPAWIPWSVCGMAGCAAIGLLALPVIAKPGLIGANRARQMQTLLGLLRSPGLLAKTAFISLIVQVASVGLVWMVGQALNSPVPVSFYWVMVPMVSVLTLLPVSVNGMGVREGATAVLLAPLGIAEGPALTLALMWFSVYAATSLLGGLVYLFGRFPKWQLASPVAAASQSGEQDAPPRYDEGVEVFPDGSFDRDSDQGRARQLEPVA